MLVVLGIIVILAGLLMPAIGVALRASHASTSQANLKQWGAATITYTAVNKDRLPWEGGPLATDMATNIRDRRFWANALGDLVGDRPYEKYVDLAVAGTGSIPSSTDRSVWIDPEAATSPDAPWPVGNGEFFYFNYVPNGRLNDSVAAQTWAENEKVISMAKITNSAATVLMLEARTNPAELPGTDPYFSERLDVCQGDWRVFPARYFDGGHVVFVDGHVAHILNDNATRSVQGSRDPAQMPPGDWNTPKMIWNPGGPAPY